MANPNGNPQNLTPFAPGKSGNPAGRPKGIPNWSEVVREILGDEDLFAKLTSKPKGKGKDPIVNLPDWIRVLPQKNLGNAIVIAMGIEAALGNDKAATWMRRTGYGDKLDLTSGDKEIKPIAIFDMRQGVPLMLAPIPPEPASVKRKQVTAKTKPAKKKATSKQPVKAK